MPRIIATGLAILLLGGAALVAPACAEGTRVGQIKTVSGEAVVVRAGERHPAQPGDAVYQQDQIETGSDGSIGITFADDSVFAAGPGSQFALDDFRFDRDSTANAMLVEVRKGTLMVISGEIPHSGPGAMKIKTPTAILGVRGTTFAVAVR